MYYQTISRLKCQHLLHSIRTEKSALFLSLQVAFLLEFTLNIKDQNLHSQMNFMEHSTTESVHHCSHDSDKILNSQKKKKRQTSKHIFDMIYKAQTQDFFS